MPEEIATLKKEIADQRAVIDAIYISVEKMRKYFVISMWVTLGAIVLPLIGIMFIAPSFVSTYTGTLESNQ
jgi:hypothetical protein